MAIDATVIFVLMSVAALLSGTAVYFQQRFRHAEQKAKNTRLHAALVSLQEERANLIVKNQIMYTDKASLSAELNQVREQQKILRGQIEKLEREKIHLQQGHQSIEKMLFTDATNE
jgi:predicted  nucleic acid-binding Zn-ribbon protein